MSFDVVNLCRRAKAAAAEAAALSGSQKNAALAAIADALSNNAAAILAANEKDCAAAAENGMSAALLDRLKLTGQRLDGICAGIRQVIALPDPVGRILDEKTAENGLKITKISVPIGVIAVIYEARPNVTPDVAALTVKSGNVCLLRGGKEAYNSGRELCAVMRAALEAQGINPDLICFVDSVDRADTALLMRQNDYIDCIIPRGGAKLIRTVREGSSVPVIETGSGICALYVAASADPEKAALITENAKTSRPSVCNAAETLLIDRAALKLLPDIYARLASHGVQLRCDPESLAVLNGREGAVAARDSDFDTEFNDYIIAVKTVDGLDAAIAHIGAHGTHHSDAIITEDREQAERFVSQVDSAAVYVNASTRFTDGGCFGLGAEIGISTQKLHARGPMGLCELTSYKYIVRGDGQIR